MMPHIRKMPSHAAVFHHWRILGLFNGTKRTCFRCRYTCSADYNLERAHIVARCDDGPDTVDNLVILCHPCHVFTDGWTRTEWVNFLTARREAA